LLTEHFLEQYGDPNKRGTIPVRIMEALCAYHWPGNVRELQNELHRYLTEQYLEFIGNVQTESEQDKGVVLGFDPAKMLFWESVQEFEKYVIKNALARNDWQRGKTAKMLNIPEKTLYNKIQKYGLKSGKD
jgi:DNA-binding NtrC family response regulator